MITYDSVKVLAETKENQGIPPEGNMESKGKLRQNSKGSLFGWTILTK